MREVTTERGTTVKVTDRGLVICDNPNAPDDMRNQEVGRIVSGGFQPAMFCAFGLTPEVLRIVADFAADGEGEA